MMEIYKEPLNRRYCHNTIGGRGLFAYYTTEQLLHRVCDVPFDGESLYYYFPAAEKSIIKSGPHNGDRTI